MKTFFVGLNRLMIEPSSFIWATHLDNENHNVTIFAQRKCSEGRVLEMQLNTIIFIKHTFRNSLFFESIYLFQTK